MKPYIFGVFFLLLAQWAQAQCEWRARIVEPPAIDGCSSKLLVLSDGRILFPVNADDWKLDSGQIVTCSFERVETPTNCSSGLPVRLTCLEPVEDVSTAGMPTCRIRINYTFEKGRVIANLVSDDLEPAQLNRLSVKWYLANGRVIGDALRISFTPTTTGEDILLCAAFAGDTDNAACRGNICRVIANPCINGDKIDTEANCPAAVKPVCGCDGVTYDNACQAENWFGVTSWTEGVCPGDTTNCQAFFRYEILGEGVVLFKDLSSKQNVKRVWSLSDGTILDDGPAGAFRYKFEKPGIYEVCLLISDGVCENKYCAEVVTGTEDELCETLDCVRPGDADDDGLVNIFDVLEIGYGYGATGPGRPEVLPNAARLNPFVPDWAGVTPRGRNYKKLDTDGNGVINFEDIAYVERNYLAAPTGEKPQPPRGGPQLFLEFSQDTIVFEENNGRFLEVNADLFLGTRTLPAFGVHGLAMYFNYDPDFFIPNTVAVDYNDNSFMGLPGEVVYLPKDLGEEGRLDLAFTRTNRKAVNGFGRIATISFIINEDIIANRPEAEVEVELSDLVLIGAEGEPLPVEFDPNLPKIVIINRSTTSVDNPELSRQILLSPNPANHNFRLLAPGIQIRHIEIFDPMGQAVYRTPVYSSDSFIDTSRFPQGWYTVRVQTDKGLAVKRLVVIR